ncbi:HEAT repeat domain-containing protein [Thalassoroseus pseudoceratinae]|uniref:HEAT repeat domain-containing protein n=1 Tax=Thalassoroseus pseudoceratinae TaxID=2713176 RepID=UPI001424343A|nr:HEAT repeat domain-containing protein [Thalassoroseus pseudoceratinae]
MNVIGIRKLDQWSRRGRLTCWATLLLVTFVAHPTRAEITVELDDATRAKCVNVLRTGLRSAEFWPSIHAAEALTLGGHGAEVVAFLEPMLQQPFDDQKRCGIARELVRAGQRQHAKIMLDILTGEESFGHTHAAESLYKVGELGDGEAMWLRFQQDNDQRLKLMAAAALGKSGDAAALEYVRAMLTHGNPELARTAAWIIGRIGNVTDIKRLQTAQDKMPDEFSRCYFEHSRANLGDAEAQAALVQNLDSDDPAIRTYAATFAGEARIADAVPKLIAMLDDETLDVRVRAAQSLLVLAQEPTDSTSLTVLPNATESVYDALTQQAKKKFAERRQAFESLGTDADYRVWQDTRREFFVEQLGGFPERTLLNAQVTGKLDGADIGNDDIRVEKILFESRPNHHVTAVLYLPKTGDAPYPAVLIACGHSKTGKGAEYNQRLGILLAKNGMAAMCYDPIGQGERSQVAEEDGHPANLSSVTEHFLSGVGAILTGTNTAQYRIWDGMRSLDYLASRDDIDATRLGCTGCSGGGTLTSYLMALDDRILCAAPACYITTLEGLIETLGPQDSEQNIYGQIEFGMEQTDYVLMRAPKPTLICSTTDDYFGIEGAWDTFRQAKRFYGRLGRPERVNLVETAGKHGITQTGRETIVRWMKRWLADVDEDVADPGFNVWPVEALHCTPKGEVLLLDGERTVFDLNEDLAKQDRTSREEFDNKPPESARATIRKIAGVRRIEQLPTPKTRTLGLGKHGEIEFRRLTMEVGDGVTLPILRLVPSKPNGRRVLLLGVEKQSAKIERLKTEAEDGTEVWAVDLRGIGELRTKSAKDLYGDWKAFFMAYLLGEAFVGQQTEDVLQCLRVMQQGLPAESKVEIVVDGHARVAALHTAALEPNMCRLQPFREPLPSWTEILDQPQLPGQLATTIHGVLEYYDLDDLKRLAGLKPHAK